MRHLATTVLLLAAAAATGCDRPTPAQPKSPGIAFDRSPVPGKPEIDPSYANGQTVYMIGPHMIMNAAQTMPNFYAHAEELYIVVYPQAPEFQPGPAITLPSGYQPQCDPCFHPGLPAPFVYHDHVLTGAPGMGNHGTAGENKAPWKIILVMYSPDYVASPDFQPITSADDLDAAEAAGNVFLPINKDLTAGDNIYEVETGNVLICPLVSSHA